MPQPISNDPEIVQRVDELTAMLAAGNNAWHNEELTDRAKIARMRLISKDMRVKLAELREYCKKIGNWVEDSVC